MVMRIRRFADWLGLAGMALLVCVFPDVGEGHALSPVAPVSSQQKPYSQPVQLEFRDAVLSEVLQAIASKTGVRFILPPDLSDHLINATIHTNGWKKALQELLDDYNHIEIWGSDLNDTQIILIGLALHADEYNIKPAQVGYESPDSKIRLSVKGSPTDQPTFSSLPPHIRNDPQVVRFLHVNGVALPETVTARYGPKMEKLPPKRKMYRHLINDQKWRRYLESLGLKHPVG